MQTWGSSVQASGVTDHAARLVLPKLRPWYNDIWHENAQLLLWARHAGEANRKTPDLKFPLELVFYSSRMILHMHHYLNSGLLLGVPSVRDGRKPCPRFKSKFSN